MLQWQEWDLQHCWHPFTDQRAWADAPPLMLVRGQGSWLYDAEGRRYFDGNASIWTNIHGHCQPTLNAALKQQLDRIAHSSFLGFSHPLAAELAARLVSFFPPQTLKRVFYSDDGSTAMECALKMALQYRMQTGEPQRMGLVALANGYHGDTLGAASLGGIALFFERFRRFGLPVQRVSAVAELQAMQREESDAIAAVVLEPLMQGVNEMRPWPVGMLRELRAWCDERGVHLILDEVLTGFGRTGKMFACQHEQVVPDFLCLAKGLTAGYMPLAATMTTEEIYRGFLNRPEHSFFYGHSYTANQLGCAVALASLRLFEEAGYWEKLERKIALLERLLRQALAPLESVHEWRQCGMMVGIELRLPDGTPFPPQQRVGAAVCLAARQFGLLTRPIRDTLVLIPPLSAEPEELEHAVHALQQAIKAVV